MAGRDSQGNFRTRLGRTGPSELREVQALGLMQAVSRLGPRLQLVAPFIEPPPELGAGRYRIAAPGARIRCPAILEKWDDITRWKEMYRLMWKVRGEPTNIAETRVVASAVRHTGRSSQLWESKLVIAVDNQATLSVIGKGRSSRPPLSTICGNIGAYTLAYGFQIFPRWVESHRNHLDGPSRQHPLGYFAGWGALAAPVARYLRDPAGKRELSDTT